MQNELQDNLFEYQSNQLNNFAQFPFVLEAPRIAFEQDFVQNGVSSGLHLMFGLQKQPNENFLEDIDTQIFSQQHDLIDLNKLFMEAPTNQFSVVVQELTQRMAEIQKKAFNNICMNKTMERAFYEHFFNYFNMREDSQFLSNFYVSFERLLIQLSKIRSEGISSILMIYEFWMRMFRNFVRQIWRHSDRYVNRNPRSRSANSSAGDSSQHRSYQESSQPAFDLKFSPFQKEKRKMWKQNQLFQLQRAIQQGISQQGLKVLATKLNRTQNSLISKINKLKTQNDPQETLQKKIQTILQKQVEGLSREDVIKQISETYMMGQEENWKKSVSQLLSSKKQIQKIKGTYTLLNPNQYIGYQCYASMKDKLILCLLKCKNFEGDIKTITEIYLNLFDRDCKNVQMMISKTLSRYEIFGKQKTRTIYKWIGVPIEHVQQKQIEFDDYFN